MRVVCFLVLFSYWCPDLLCIGEGGFGFGSRYLGVAFVLLKIGFGYVTPPCWKFVAAASGCVRFWDLVLDFGETHTAVGPRCWFM
jgi:hypothetical protein